MKNLLVTHDLFGRYEDEEEVFVEDGSPIGTVSLDTGSGMLFVARGRTVVASDSVERKVSSCETSLSLPLSLSPLPSLLFFTPRALCISLHSLGTVYALKGSSFLFSWS